MKKGCHKQWNKRWQWYYYDFIALSSKLTTGNNFHNQTRFVSSTKRKRRSRRSCPVVNVRINGKINMGPDHHLQFDQCCICSLVALLCFEYLVFVAGINQATRRTWTASYCTYWYISTMWQEMELMANVLQISGSWLAMQWVQFAHYLVLFCTKLRGYLR